MKRNYCCLLVFGIIGLMFGCTPAVQPGSATSENAIAAYVVLRGDRASANRLIDPLTMAGLEDPSEPAGFIRGLRATFATRDPDGSEGLRVIFQEYATTDDRERLAERAASTGLNVPIWLGALDEWPDCVGTPDCDLVGDSPSLP